MCRESLGLLSTLMNGIVTEEKDQHIIRMDEHKFNKLLNLVVPYIKNKDTRLYEAPLAKLKLEIALRFLASRESFLSLLYSFRVPVSSISIFLPVKGHQISTFSLSGLCTRHILCYTNICIFTIQFKQCYNF